MSVGFIQLHRSILSWEWYNDIPTKTLFIHLLLKANYKEKKWRGIIVPRGSVLCGRKKLAEETGLTESQIRTSLNKLKSTRELTTESHQNYSMISITNYDMYQGSDQQIATDMTTQSPTDRQRIATTNKGNNINNINNNNPPIVPPKGDRGKTIDNFFKSEYPDEEIACPEEWGIMAYEIYHELTDKPAVDLFKEITWEFDNFYNYWHSLGSLTKARKKNWQSTWRIWWKRRAEQLFEKEKKDEFFKKKYS